MSAAYKPEKILDTMSRPLGSLRISVTDRCNLRCRYCMPQEEYAWLPRQDLLTFEEIAELAAVFAELGTDKVRLTGGEPLLRRDLPVLVKMLAANPRVRELALTTNGILLAGQAAALRAAGLGRVNISLDTLRPERFLELTRRDALPAVLEGIGAAWEAGFRNTKFDSVILRGHNEDEIIALLEFAMRSEAEIRFLEYMDVAGATQWTPAQVFSREEILRTIAGHYGSATPLGDRGPAPAERFRLPGGATFGIISSTTTPFCRACDRSRLTADGMWFLCLYATQGVNLRDPLRAGATHEELKARIRSVWQGRTDRGAEIRQQLTARTAFIPVEGLRKDPHLEMHTRGG